MNVISKLLRKNKTLGIATAFCLIILTLGISWAVANANILIVESSILKVELSR